MKKLDINWGINLVKDENLTYYSYLIYNPNKPMIDFEEAEKTGKEANPTGLFSLKEKLEESDLPEGFKLFKRIGRIYKDK